MHPQTAQHPCASVEDYIAGICSALPEENVQASLKDLKCFRFTDANPEPSESLMTWEATAQKGLEGKLPITLVVGDTLGTDNNRERATKPTLGRMTMACTCDAAAGSEAALGMIHRSGCRLEEVDYAAVLDEWPGINRRLNSSHLIVVGSPEVNICSAFLHGLVEGFHFGKNLWPPDMSTMREVLSVRGESLRRSLHDDKVNHCGIVVLLRNPWNPEFRLLWIAGLTGRGTRWGCSLIAGKWGELAEESKRAVGVVFGSEFKGASPVIRPRYWKRLSEGRFTWETDDVGHSITPHIGMSPQKNDRREFHVFLSYNHKDKMGVHELKHRLAQNGIKAWLDEDELRPGVSWPELLEKGIRSSQSVAVLIGPDGLGPWHNEEMKGALRLAVRDKRPVIPVLLPGAPTQPELPVFLEDRTWVDLRAGFTADRMVHLMWGITGEPPEILQRNIAMAGGAQQGQRIILPTHNLGGASPGVNFDDGRALRDLLDEDGIARC